MRERLTTGSEDRTVRPDEARSLFAPSGRGRAWGATVEWFDRFLAR